jgi:hypothetical protein
VEYEFEGFQMWLCARGYIKKRVSKKREILRLAAEVWGFSKKKKRNMLHRDASLRGESSSEELKDTTRTVICFTIKRYRFSSEATPLCFV